MVTGFELRSVTFSHTHSLNALIAPSEWHWLDSPPLCSYQTNGKSESKTLPQCLKYTLLAAFTHSCPVCIVTFLPKSSAQPKKPISIFIYISPLFTLIMNLNIFIQNIFSNSNRIYKNTHIKLIQIRILWLFLKISHTDNFKK